MGIYSEKVLPHIVDCGGSLAGIMELRAKVVPLAFGDVLEVGMGTALNVAYYDANHVNKVWGLEPSAGMREKARMNLARSRVPVEWLSLPGEEIPLDDSSVDSVVLTFTLCTIPDWRAAMTQIHRVLKPGGKMFFCEHGRAPDTSVQKWQDRLNPVWKRLLGGCNLNRPVIENIKCQGFSIEWQESAYLENSPRITSFMTVGAAVKG